MHQRLRGASLQIHQRYFNQIFELAESLSLNHTPKIQHSNSECEFDYDYAFLQLEAARAKKNVQQAEKHLAESKLEEYRVLVRLYQRRTQMAEQKLADADDGIGQIRVAIRQKGYGDRK